MANRVLLGQRGSDYGLWVSKPGQNVLTAPDRQLQFNSNLPAFGILEQGTYTVNWNISAGPFDGGHSHDVMFAQSYGTPPLVWIDLPVGSHVRMIQSGPTGTFGISVSSNVPLARWRVTTRSLHNRLRVTGEWMRQYTGYVIPNVTLRYTVYSFNL